MTPEPWRAGLWRFCVEVAAIVAIALAGCGGSSTAGECAKLRAQADAWAKTFLADEGLPASQEAAQKRSLAAADLQTLAVQNHVSCGG